MEVALFLVAEKTVWSAAGTFSSSSSVKLRGFPPADSVVGMEERVRSARDMTEESNDRTLLSVEDKDLECKPTEHGTLTNVDASRLLERKAAVAAATYLLLPLLILQFINKVVVIRTSKSFQRQQRMLLLVVVATDCDGRSGDVIIAFLSLLEKVWLDAWICSIFSDVIGPCYRLYGYLSF